MTLKHFHENINETAEARFLRFTSFQFAVDNELGKFILHTDDGFEEPETIERYTNHLANELAKEQSTPDPDYL